MGLRDDIFNNDAPVSTGYVDGEPAIMRDPVIVEDRGLSAGDSELDSFHTTQPDDIEPNNTPKILGALAVALMIGAAGGYYYLSSGSHSQVVTAAKLPENSPAQVAAATPPPAPPAPAAQNAMAMPPADATTPKSDVASNDVTPMTKSGDDAGKTSQPKHVRQHVARADTSSGSVPDAASARMAADGNAPAQTAAATPVPDPVINNQAPANSVAANTPSPQAVPQAAPQDVTPTAPAEQAAAPAAPATPEVAAAQPAPQQPATQAAPAAPTPAVTAPAPAQAPTVQDNQPAPAAPTPQQ